MVPWKATALKRWTVTDRRWRQCCSVIEIHVIELRNWITSSVIVIVIELHFKSSNCNCISITILHVICNWMKCKLQITFIKSAKMPACWVDPGHPFNWINCSALCLHGNIIVNIILSLHPSYNLTAHFDRPKGKGWPSLSDYPCSHASFLASLLRLPTENRASIFSSSWASL